MAGYIKEYRKQDKGLLLKLDCRVLDYDAQSAESRC